MKFDVTAFVCLSKDVKVINDLFLETKEFQNVFLDIISGAYIETNYTSQAITEIIHNQETKNTKQDHVVFGTPELYETHAEKIKILHVLYVDNIGSGDVFQFPMHQWRIKSFSELRTLSTAGLVYRHIVYEHTFKIHDEFSYLNELKDILETGEERDDRTGVGTISKFGHQMRFDITSSIPFITTKALAWKAVIKELIWFLRGCTDSKLLEKEGVNIWKPNSTREFLDERGLDKYEVGDIGPMYGFVWKHFGAQYNGCKEDYTGKGINQIQRLIQGLKKDPFSRRHMITTFCPEYADQGVLIPCHGIVTQMHVHESKEGKERQLSCHVYCRSQDTFLGQPFNIASYALFTYIIATICDMKPKELIISTGDTHIYKNHVNQVKEQLQRSPLPFPVVCVSKNIKTKQLEDIDINDFEVIGYMHHPAIKAPMAV